MRLGQVHIGDARTLAGQLAPQSVHMVVTSPPYWKLRSYLAQDHPNKAAELGNEATVEEYVANLVGLFALLRPALRSDGVAWVNLGDCFGEGKQLQGVPWRVAFALQADGWVLRSDIIWAKNNPMPESVRDRPTRSHEYLFLLSKGPRYYYDAEAVSEPAEVRDYGQDKINRVRNVGGRDDGYTGTVGGYGLGHTGKRNKRDVWTIPTQPYPDAHFATFPPDLVRPCIRAGTSERGVCAACGAPWGRVVEREQGQRNTFAGSNGQQEHRPGASHTLVAVPAVTTGWQPSCQCGTTATRPAVVLDCFAGSGTVAEVCVEEGRDWLAFDLDERSIGWHANRLRALPVRSLFAATGM